VRDTVLPLSKSIMLWDRQLTPSQRQGVRHNHAAVHMAYQWSHLQKNRCQLQVAPVPASLYSGQAAETTNVPKPRLCGVFYNTLQDAAVRGAQVMLSNSNHTPEMVTMLPSLHANPADTTAAHEIQAGHHFLYHAAQSKEVELPEGLDLSQTYLESPSQTTCLKNGWNFEKTSRDWPVHLPISWAIQH